MEFWRFIAPPHHHETPLLGSHDPILVALSIFVACLAGYAALSVVDRMAAVKKASTQRWWLIAGAMAMGSGIWAMHFTAMLAHSLSMPVSYEVWITCISVIPAILGSGIALLIMRRETIEWRQLQIGGLLMALGIGTMHYIGMEAMRMNGVMRYDLDLFVLSIVVAHLLATAALYVKCVCSNKETMLKHWFKLISATIMGIAVSGMHYTAMAASRFYPSPAHDMPRLAFQPLEMGVSICIVTSLISALAIIGAMIDRRLDAAAESLRESEAWADAILNTVTDGIISFDSTGIIMSYNKTAATIFDYTAHEALGNNVKLLMPVLDYDERPSHPNHYLDQEAATFASPYYEIEAKRKNRVAFPLELGVAELTRDNQQLFIASIRDVTERKQAEREREELQKQLIDISRQAGMAEMATGVLHNVGNVLNSVNVSASILAEKLEKSSVASLSKASALINDHTAALGAFVTEDDRGKHLPQFLSQLALKLESERTDLASEVASLMRNVEHIKEIVSMQQAYAKVSGMQEEIDIVDLVDDAVKTAAASLTNHGIELVREVDAVPALLTEKHKILQILVNLISNAKHAIQQSDDAVGPEPRLILRIFQLSDTRVAVEVEDNGVGIAPENLTQIFQHGFTTKKEGHGFGLHSSAVAAQEVGGALTVRSDGLGCGATFRLELLL